MSILSMTGLSQTAQTENIMRDFPASVQIPDARKKIRDAHCRNNRVLAVLDDDPTGTQTVHDIDVYLECDQALIDEAVETAADCFYISTNSRSVNPRQAAAISRSLGHSLVQAERLSGRSVTVASRSDSTLRGHFPVEVEALLEGMAQSVDGILVVPAFFEGGRYTVDDTHWLESEDGLVPVATTEFARDPSFGYSHSNLCEWIEEKTLGCVKTGDVHSISIELIRKQGVEGVATLLKQAKDNRYIVVNALQDSDLEIVALALTEAESFGKRFLFRCAASMIKNYVGIEDVPLLNGREVTTGGPGLIVVGSYVQKTSDQLSVLMTLPAVTSIEIAADDLVSGVNLERIPFSTINKIDTSLKAGQTVVIFTSRERKDLQGKEFLAFGEQVMMGLIKIIQRIETKPAFVVSKGGITSHSIAKKALGVSRAKVLGQIAPGVAVWRLGKGAKWEGIPYVVFPGNVGTVNTLSEVVSSLLHQNN